MSTSVSRGWSPDRPSAALRPAISGTALAASRTGDARRVEDEVLDACLCQDRTDRQPARAPSTPRFQTFDLPQLLCIGAGLATGCARSEPAGRAKAAETKRRLDSHLLSLVVSGVPQMAPSGFPTWPVSSVASNPCKPKPVCTHFGQLTYWANPRAAAARTGACQGRAQHGVGTEFRRRISSWKARSVPSSCNELAVQRA